MTKSRAKLLVCVDGSAYADSICESAAWAAQKMDASIDLLHVLRRHSDYEAPGNDHTGSIGLGARTQLLEKLTKVDEDRGRLDQTKGKIILEHAEDTLKKAGIENINQHHRRGDLVETIQEFEKDADLIFIGKRGEHANRNSEYLGSNLEKVARAIYKPLFVVSSIVRKKNIFMIAYDGKTSAKKAVDFACTSPLLKGMHCHLFAAEHKSGDIDTAESKTKLEQAGFTVISSSKQTDDIDGTITAYIEENKIDLMLTGAYSHSRIRSFLLGSTTASLIKSCHIPLILFR